MAVDKNDIEELKKVAQLTKNKALKDSVNDKLDKLNKDKIVTK